MGLAARKAGPGALGPRGRNGTVLERDEALTILDANEPSPVLVERPEGRSPFLLACDHAGRAIPRRLDALGLAEPDLSRHIAWDIGVWAVSRALAAALDATLIGQRYSRLVVDCNRPLGVPSSVPPVSDGTLVPGNQALDDRARRARIAAIFAPYHARLAATVADRRAAGRPTVLISMHSFTPALSDAGPASRSPLRPWPIGTLYGRDGRLAAALRPHLVAAGLDGPVGDNEPYAVSDGSDYTLPVHGARAGIPSVGNEIRQDLIADADGQARWAAILATAFPAALADLAALDSSTLSGAP